MWSFDCYSKYSGDIDEVVIEYRGVGGESPTLTVTGHRGQSSPITDIPAFESFPYTLSIQKYNSTERITICRLDRYIDEDKNGLIITMLSNEGCNSIDKFHINSDCGLIFQADEKITKVSNELFLKCAFIEIHKWTDDSVFCGKAVNPETRILAKTGFKTSYRGEFGPGLYSMTGLEITSLESEIESLFGSIWDTFKCVWSTCCCCCVCFSCCNDADDEGSDRGIIGKFLV